MLVLERQNPGLRGDGADRQGGVGGETGCEGYGPDKGNGKDNDRLLGVEEPFGAGLNVLAGEGVWGDHGVQAGSDSEDKERRDCENSFDSQSLLGETKRR